jgi:hypothetical protein
VLRSSGKVPQAAASTLSERGHVHRQGDGRGDFTGIPKTKAGEAPTGRASLCANSSSLPSGNSGRRIAGDHSGEGYGNPRILYQEQRGSVPADRRRDTAVGVALYQDIVVRGGRKVDPAGNAAKEVIGDLAADHRSVDVDAIGAGACIILKVV